MQKKLLGLIVVLLCATGVLASSPSALTLIIHFSDDMEPVFTLPLSGAGTIDIDWGDGSLTSLSNPNIETMPDLLMHRYDAPGGYMIHVLGDLNEAHFGVTSATAVGINALQAVTDWGAISYVSFEGAFRTAEHLQAVPDWLLFGVTNLMNMFSGAIAFNSDLQLWETSNVTNMTRMFADAWEFNGDIRDWNTSNVMHMDSMFHRASAFDQDLLGRRVRLRPTQ